MNRTHRKLSTMLRSRSSRLAALLLFCCAGAAQAQFVWIGPNGTRHYSDQPPPPGTPASKILKAPGRPAPAQELPEPPESAKTKAPTLAEREADFRKRAREREEQESKSQAQAKQAAARAEQCEGLRKNQRLYQSGVRVAEMDANGQKRYLSDAERAAAAQQTARQLQDCR